MATTYELIAKNILGSNAASISFSSIPATYTDLLIVFSLRTNQASTSSNLKVTFNSNGTGYSRRSLQGDGSSAASYNGSSEAGILYIDINGANSTSSTFGSGGIYVPNYAGSTNKSASVEYAWETNATAAGIGAIAALWANTAAIDTVTLTEQNGNNLVTNSSAYLYRIRSNHE